MNVSAVVSVDAEIEEEFKIDDVIQREDRIVSQWRALSADEQHELRGQFDEILRPLGFETSLLVIRRANSIALYFFCVTLLAVTSLRDLFRSGQLRDIVESLFSLLHSTDYLDYLHTFVSVKKLTWPVSDYERCLQFFRSFQG